MNINTVYLLIVAAAFINLSACTYIKGLFPDKEKDYQFTTEIKPLTLPSDLSDNPIFKEAEEASVDTIDSGTNQDSSQSGAHVSEETHQEAGAENTESPQEPELKSDESVSEDVENQSSKSSQSSEEHNASEPVAGVNAAQETTDGSGHTPETTPAEEQSAGTQEKKSETTPVQMVIYDDGESRLRIGAEPAKAWRMVGKALSRLSVEVISRNQEDLSYTVNFDPEEKQITDDSLWDEVVFLFGGFQAKGKEYELRLVENDLQTDVAALDEDGKPASDTGALRLLKLIQKTIRGD